MIKGNKVYLSSIERASLETLRNWRNNEDLRSYFREYREISCDMQNMWYEKRVLNNDHQIDFEIRKLSDQKLIGHCSLNYINWINRTAEFGIYVGDENEKGKGFGSEALRLLIKYGFEEINLNKIWCEVYEHNQAMGIYKHIGFVHEGTLRQNYYHKGKYLDSHILSILKDEFLNFKEKKEI